MRKIVIISGIAALIIIGALYAKRKYYDPRHRMDHARREINALVDKGEVQNGDLIFQTSLSRQSIAIQLATQSKYSHCGLIFKKGNGFFVFEAVQPVKLTPLNHWIARGKEGKFVIKRLKNAGKILTPSTCEKMMAIGNQFKGKSYDLTFEWSDDKIYCSELIWKIYERATGLQIGKLQRLRDFNLSDPAVQSIMKKRYGNRIPLEETVISPVSIFDSELLRVVKTNE
ncbi:MAG TPA: YiiX family permuted papain-like enzyme [Bacteroidales bacterium]|nr:YiiX family permuted papain-like enzyme [Bacteroidales bacterium]